MENDNLELGVSELTCDICCNTIRTITTIYSTDGSEPVVIHQPGDKFTCLECIIKTYDEK